MDEQIKADLAEIKADVKELVKQGAIHNHMLSQLDSRSTKVEARVGPLEDDYKFRQKLRNILLGSGGIVTIIAVGISLISLLRSH